MAFRASFWDSVHTRCRNHSFFSILGSQFTISLEIPGTRKDLPASQRIRSEGRRGSLPLSDSSCLNGSSLQLWNLPDFFVFQLKRLSHGRRHTEAERVLLSRIRDARPGEHGG